MCTYVYMYIYTTRELAATYNEATVLKHTATHCNTLQHTATHCNTLRHTATHCDTPQYTAIHRNKGVKGARRTTSCTCQKQSHSCPRT